MCCFSLATVIVICSCVYHGACHVYDCGEVIYWTLNLIYCDCLSFFYCGLVMDLKKCLCLIYCLMNIFFGRVSVDFWTVIDFDGLLRLRSRLVDLDLLLPISYMKSMKVHLMLTARELKNEFNCPGENPVQSRCRSLP